jgi:hypothetical protein
VKRPNEAEIHNQNQKKNMRKLTFQNKLNLHVKPLLKSIPPARQNQQLLFVPLCPITTTVENKQF